MTTNIRYHPIPGYDVSFPAITSLIELYAEHKLINTYIPKSKNRANLGTTAHALIARIIKGGHITDEEWPTLGKDAQNAVLAFLRWQEAVKFKPRFAETLVYSLKYGIAGHPDAGGVCYPWYIGVFDWKLGEIQNIRVRLQVSAYGFCIAEMYPRRRKPDGFRAVHLDTRIATYEELIIPYDEGEHYFHEFIRMKKEVGII